MLNVYSQLQQLPSTLDIFEADSINNEAVKI